MSNHKDLMTAWAAYRKAKGMPEAKTEQAPPVEIEDDFFTDLSLDEEEIALEEVAVEQKPDRLSQIMAKHKKVPTNHED